MNNELYDKIKFDRNDFNGMCKLMDLYDSLEADMYIATNEKLEKCTVIHSPK